MTTLCLNMIVKNESHIIEETLENLCQYFSLDYWVISDTGSTDNTIEIIENFFKNKKIAGEIHQEAWQDFAYNRNKALEACAGKADYVLFFDADDLMQGDFKLPARLIHDAYYFQFTDEEGSTRYTRRLIVKNDQNYQWKCVLHELLENQRVASEALLEGDYLVISRRQGDRNKDPNKVLKDALVLQEAFYKGKDTIYLPRYAFYCAQSYRAHSFTDPTYLSNAIEWYKKRIELRIEGLDIDDEAYVSCQYLGIIYQQQQQFEQAIAIWQKGILQDPYRAECWYHTAHYCRLQQHWQLAYAYARQGAALAAPQGRRIFLSQDIHQFWCLFELCIISYQLDYIEESYQTFKKLIKTMPANLLNDLFPIMPSYISYIKADRHDEVIQIKADLTRLGYPHYLEKLELSY